MFISVLITFTYTFFCHYTDKKNIKSRKKEMSNINANPGKITMYTKSGVGTAYPTANNKTGEIPITAVWPGGYKSGKIQKNQKKI